MQIRHALLAGLVLLAAAPCALAGPAEILRAAAQPDASADDLAAWKELEHEETLPVLLDALTGDDVTLALFAVEHVDHLDLTLSELRFAGRLVTDHPERWCGKDGRSIRLVVAMLGVNEVARFWESVVEKGLDFYPGDARSTFRSWLPCCRERRPRRLERSRRFSRPAPTGSIDIVTSSPAASSTRMRGWTRRTADRRPRPYWPATLALAIAGDTDARAESLGMIRDGRTWMFDRLNFAPALTCATDPEFVAHWVDRLEACCCQAWPSCWILGSTFPVLDIPEIVRGHMATQRQARAALTGARFRRSHILDAWVPVR